jgi:phage N-6-adenine-methyltransferase
LTNAYINPSKSTEWGTPPALFKELNDEFCFDYDAAASHENHLCSTYSTLDGTFHCKDEKHHWTKFSSKDGLEYDWSNQITWCNPPYGKGIASWIQKAFTESSKSFPTVMLLPAYPDRKWFHTYVLNQPKVEVRFLKGRLKFVGAKDGAPFPSMVVIFR